MRRGCAHCEAKCKAQAAPRDGAQASAPGLTEGASSLRPGVPAPSLVSFSAGLTRKPFPSDAGVVLFNKVLVNDGDVYDPSTGESARTHGRSGGLSQPGGCEEGPSRLPRQVRPRRRLQDSWFLSPKWVSSSAGRLLWGRTARPDGGSVHVAPSPREQRGRGHHACGRRARAPRSAAVPPPTGTSGPGCHVLLWPGLCVAPGRESALCGQRCELPPWPRVSGPRASGFSEHQSE